MKTHRYNCYSPLFGVAGEVPAYLLDTVVYERGVKGPPESERPSRKKVAA